MIKRNFLWLVVIMTVIASVSGVPAASAAQEPAAALQTPPRQDAATKPYVWEEMGITFEIPSDWDAFSASSDYDLALVSAAASSGADGAFLTFRSIPYLGQTFEEAMQPLADEVSSAVEPYTAAGLTGVRIVSSDAETSVQQWMVLLPYSEDGEALFAQGSAPEADAPQLEAVLGSMTVEQPHSDVEAINAAWQASLAENGTLIYGSADAPVHIVEYFSFTCGHCANYTTSIERLIALEVEEAGRVRFELAPVMWDDYASRTARAFYCAAEQGQGYSAYKALFRGYFVDGYDVAYTDEGVTAIMTGLGLDMDNYAACVQEDRYASAITAIETRFRDGGITATPTLAFGVNGDEPAAIPVGEGQLWSGAIPLSTLRTILSMLIDQGMSVQDLYYSE